MTKNASTESDVKKFRNFLESVPSNYVPIIKTTSKGRTLSSVPVIDVTPGVIYDNNVADGLGFFVSGSGFVPGHTLTIAWSYFDHTDLTTDNDADNPVVDSNGRFTSLCPCENMAFAGTLSVLATDPANGLNATTTVNVSTTPNNPITALLMKTNVVQS